MSTPIGDSFRGPEGRLGYLLRQAHHAMRAAIDAEVRAIGVTAPQYSVLSVIRHEAGLSVTELAEDSMLRQQTASEIVRALERGGLVERRADPKDGRTRRIHLTRDGWATVAEADERVARLEDESVDRLDPNQRVQVAEWLVDCARTFSDRRAAHGRRGS